jgi:hypothetical protein
VVIWKIGGVFLRNYFKKSKARRRKAKIIRRITIVMIIITQSRTVIPERLGVQIGETKS